MGCSVVVDPNTLGRTNRRSGIGHPIVPSIYKIPMKVPNNLNKLLHVYYTKTSNNYLPCSSVNGGTSVSRCT